MIHNERSIDIDAAPEEVWGVLGRYMHMHEFAPSIESIDALTEGEDGVGSKTTLQFRRRHFSRGGSHRVGGQSVVSRPVSGNGTDARQGGSRHSVGRTARGHALSNDDGDGLSDEVRADRMVDGPNHDEGDDG